MEKTPFLRSFSVFKSYFSFKATLFCFLRAAPQLSVTKLRVFKQKYFDFLEKQAKEGHLLEAKICEKNENSKLFFLITRSIDRVKISSIVQNKAYFFCFTVIYIV